MNRPIKVMLIDDDPGIHESLRAVIEEAGYEFCWGSWRARGASAVG